MEKVLVIGGSNVDYIGKCFYDVIDEDSNIGNINISFGGVGRNIVENLARLGVDVTFVTNIGQDIMGHELKKELNSLGVTVYTPEGIKKSGGYLAIHDKHGNLSLALCEQSGIEKIEPKYLETLDNLIQSYNYIVIDTNFDKTTISYLLNKYQGKTIFIDAISTEKGKKVIGFENCISYLKCNRLEAETIFGNNYFEKFQNNNSLIVTNGSESIEYNLGKDIYTVSVNKVEAVNSIGCGDAFFSGFIFAIINGMSEKEAIEIGKKVANITLLAEGAVNKELTKEKIL